MLQPCSPGDMAGASMQYERANRGGGTGISCHASGVEGHAHQEQGQGPRHPPRRPQRQSPAVTEPGTADAASRSSERDAASYRYGPELTPVGADNPEAPRPSPRVPPAAAGSVVITEGAAPGLIRKPRKNSVAQSPAGSGLPLPEKPACRAGESGLPRPAGSGLPRPGPGFPPPEAEPNLRS